MKRIAVFFDDPDYHDYPFDTGNYYEDSYIELGRILQRKGGEFWVVRDQSTYKGNNVFSGGWVFRDDGFKRVDEPVTVDLIYDKGHFEADENAKTLNSRGFDDVCTNKYHSYEAFPEFFVPTYLVRNRDELREKATKLKTDKIVAKPLGGEGGNGIVIGSHEDVTATMKEFPCIVQEFMDTSVGIPGLVEGRHDFRMVSMQGEIVCANIRTPKEGSYLANIAQGGHIFDVDLDKIPAEALEIFNKVDTVFRRYTRRHYALDVCRTPNGWRMIELNARPGLPERTEEGFQDFMERLADLLMQD